MWTYGKDSFLPHGTRADGFAEAPADLSDRRGRATRTAATILVLVDGAEAPDLATFARCLDLFDGGDPEAVARARDRWREAAAAGHGCTYWQQGERGGWSKAARAGSRLGPSAPIAAAGPPL